jgi:hypothetical protein
MVACGASGEPSTLLNLPMVRWAVRGGHSRSPGFGFNRPYPRTPPPLRNGP